MILYLGNMLSGHTGSVSVIELLGKKLSMNYEIKMYSTQKSKIIRLMDMVWRIVQYRKQAKVVLIDVYSTNAFWYAVLSALCCRVLNIPFIPIIHGGNFPERLKNSREICDFVFYKSALNISPSVYLMVEFEKLNYPIIHIPNSIELTDISYKQRKQLTPRLLWVRSFQEIYNPVMAVEVLFILKQRFSDARLCMIGSVKGEPYQKVLDRIRELGVEDNIKIPGIMKRLEWHQLSSEYDIFINTTNFDNMPLSVLEAMALGMPVVSTNVGGIPYLIADKEDGLLVPQNNTHEMANAIISLVDDPDKAESIGLKARTRVKEFDWEKVKQRWFDVIDNFELPRVPR